MKEAKKSTTSLGETWSKTKEADECEIMVENAIKAWQIKVPKLLSNLNPIYGKFIETCGEMYALYGTDQASRTNTLDCGLDIARMFTAMALKDKLHHELITTQCTLSLRKDYLHPTRFL